MGMSGVLLIPKKTGSWALDFYVICFCKKKESNKKEAWYLEAFLSLIQSYCNVSSDPPSLNACNVYHVSHLDISLLVIKI